MDFHLFPISVAKRGNEHFMIPMVGSAHCTLFLMIIKEKLYVAAMYWKCGLLLIKGESLILLFHEKTDVFRMHSSAVSLLAYDKLGDRAKITRNGPSSLYSQVSVSHI